MIGFSPVYPLQKDNYLGAYAVTETLAEVAKQNFINLMLTSPGERVMDINFGVGLRNYLFELNSRHTQSRISSRIESQVATYLPFVDIQEVGFNQALGIGNNENLLTVSVTYSIPSVGISETFSIGSATSVI